MSSNINILRICQLCGNEFTARTTVTKYCSDQCAKRAYKIRKREEKINQSNVETKIIREQPLELVKSKDFLTVKDVAVLLSCSTRGVYHMIESGRLQAVNLSKRKIRIKRSEIDKIFNDNDFHIQPKVAIKGNAPVMVEDCYHIGELETLFNMANRTLFRLLERNNVEKMKVGKYVYVAKKDIDKLLIK